MANRLSNQGYYQGGLVSGLSSISLELISKSRIPFHSSIIDVGGGDSLLVDGLLELGYKKLTVLDISASALEKAQHRLGNTAALIRWEVSDVLEFESKENFDL